MFGSIKSRLVLRSALNDLKSAETREAALRELCERSARELAANPDKLDAWRNPVLQAAETLDECGEDAADAFRAAIAVMRQESYWRHELLKRILPRAQMREEDIIYLEEEALANPRNFGTWKRLLEEVKRLGDKDRFAHVRELFVLKLAEFFPAKGENTWFDIETESQARSLFFNFLDDAVDYVIASGRHDSDARQVLEFARDRFPQRHEVQYGLAKIYQASGEQSAEALETMLMGVLHNPSDSALKIAAAQLLMNRAGHEEEGIHLIRQVWEEQPDNQQALGLLAGHYLQNGGMNEDTVDIVRRWLADNEGDERAALALADYHAQRGDQSRDAIRIYEAAAAIRSDDPRYIKSLAEARYAQKNWAEAARGFARLAELNALPAELIVPYATSLAETNRLDPDATRIYAEAYRSGSTDPFILSTYCKALYHQNPSDVEALEAFHKIYRAQPRCLWAALGVARKEMTEGNGDAALEKLAQLLVAEHEIEEAMELAAQIVANNPKRAMIRQLTKLDPKIALRIFERASARQPDALPLMQNIARYRLAQGMKDAETEKILATICKRDPEDTETRLARADLLHDMGRLDKAVELYKELINRSRATTPHGRNRFDADERARMLSRTLAFLVRTTIKNREDMTFLIEAALDPGTAADNVIAVAKKVINTGVEHPLDLPLFERALAAQPDDEELELACARARAHRGNARELISLAVKRLEAMNYEPENVALLVEAAEMARASNITADIEQRVIRFFETRRFIPDQIAINMAQLLLIQGGFKSSFRPVFRRVAALPKPNPEFLEALDRCRETTQDDSQSF